MKHFLCKALAAGVFVLTAGLLLFSVSASASYILPGDVNGDGTVDIADASLVLQNSLFPDQYPVSYPGSLDFDGDGAVDIRDAVRLIQYSMYPELYPLAEPDTPDTPEKPETELPDIPDGILDNLGEPVT